MKTNFKKYVSIVLALCLAIALVCLVACKDNKHPDETTSEEITTSDNEHTTTPAPTTPAETTPSTPAETVTFPSDEEVDPKQEDVFFE